MKKKNNLKSLDQFVEEQNGKKGTTKRDKFDKGFKAFELGVISKIENNIKEVRISTLQKIVELGLGGHLELTIKL